MFWPTGECVNGERDSRRNIDWTDWSTVWFWTSARPEAWWFSCSLYWWSGIQLCRLFCTQFISLLLCASFCCRLSVKYGVFVISRHLLEGENQPEYQACQSALTVEHILIDCTHLSAVRQRYFRVKTLKQLYEVVDSRNIIAFIKDINFYCYIKSSFYIS